MNSVRIRQRLVDCLAAELPLVWTATCYCYSAFRLLRLTAWYGFRARLDYLMDSPSVFIFHYLRVDLQGTAGTARATAIRLWPMGGRQTRDSRP